jgi:hypothetical protein
MFESVELVAEVLVVGTLLLVASAPMWRGLGVSTKDRDAVLQGYSTLPKAAVMVAVAYAVGVFITRVPARIEGVQTSAEASYAGWSPPKGTNAVPRLRDAEFVLRERSDGLVSWIERHKSYIRVAGGTAIAALFAAIGVGVCLIRGQPRDVYRRRHLVLALLTFVGFGYAWWAQKSSVDSRICRTYVQLVLGTPDQTKPACGE